VVSGAQHKQRAAKAGQEARKAERASRRILLKQ